MRTWITLPLSHSIYVVVILTRVVLLNVYAQQYKLYNLI